MIIHIGYDVCVESEEVLMILSLQTIRGAGASLLENAKKQGTFCGIPPSVKAACRAYLLLQKPASLRQKLPSPLRLTASCLSPAALQKRLQVPNLLLGKDME